MTNDQGRMTKREVRTTNVEVQHMIEAGKVFVRHSRQSGNFFTLS